MRTFAARFIGAARLTPAIYEEVEADTTATGQAMLVVALASVAGGIGLTGDGAGLLVGTGAALFGWVIWAALIYVLGAKVFPQPQTQVDIGELLRTTGFAAGPGVLRVFGIVPGLGPLILLAVSVWMLVAMVNRGAAGARLHLDGPRPHGVRGGVDHHAHHDRPPRRIPRPRRPIGLGCRGALSFSST